MNANQLRKNIDLARKSANSDIAFLDSQTFTNPIYDTDTARQGFNNVHYPKKLKSDYHGQKGKWAQPNIGDNVGVPDNGNNGAFE
jgi:hypothetical protein